MEAKKTELEKRVAGIEGMVANLIVDQQAMATSFNARGDRHSGSLDHHQATLTALGRFQEKMDTNINTLVEECTILQTQVESLGDNVCRWAQEKPSAFVRFLLSRSLGVGNVVTRRIGRALWSTPMHAPMCLITLLRSLRRTWFLCLFPSLLFQLLINCAHLLIRRMSRLTLSCCLL